MYKKKIAKISKFLLIFLKFKLEFLGCIFKNKLKRLLKYIEKLKTNN